jgi:GTP-binding protein
VGKSTLFNRLTGTRDALVADFPGLTRDRHFGKAKGFGKPFLVVDTGGFEPLVKDGILKEMARQSELAMAEADVVVFLVDGRGGLTPQDKEIAARLRRLGTPAFVAVNKTEGMDKGVVAAEFHELGLGEPWAISAAHGQGVNALVQEAMAAFPEPEESLEADEKGKAMLKVALAGRPNAGKSTLANAFLGEERMIAFDMPGTTRDAVAADFEHHGVHYRLVDTAGLRKKGKVFEAIEKFSVIKTLQAIEAANVVILLLDAEGGISEQDAHIAGFAIESGRAVVVAVNKWDALNAYAKAQAKQAIENKLKFLDFAPVLFISALENVGLAKLLYAVDAAFASATAKLPTPKLTRVLQEAIARQAPPRHGAIRPKMRYAHQGGQNPPIIVIHGNALEHVPPSYKRYLENTFRETFRLSGTPLRIVFQTSENPYAEKAEKARLVSKVRKIKGK